MKARTKTILRAAEDAQLMACENGVCAALYRADKYYLDVWFDRWFRPPYGLGIDGLFAYWLGDLTPKNLELRYTFIAMAAAVSETED